GLGGSDRLLGVLVVHRADRDDIDPLVLEQLAIVGVHAGAGQAVPLASGLGILATVATEGNDLGMRVLLVGLDVLSGHPADADDPDAKLFLASACACAGHVLLTSLQECGGAAHASSNPGPG